MLYSSNLKRDTKMAKKQKPTKKMPKEDKMDMKKDAKKVPPWKKK